MAWIVAVGFGLFSIWSLVLHSLTVRDLRDARYNVRWWRAAARRQQVIALAAFDELDENGRKRANNVAMCRLRERGLHDLGIPQEQWCEEAS